MAVGRRSPGKAGMVRRAELGLHWLRCGWRLFRRNPWLLTGIGLTAAMLLTLLAGAPLVGGLLVALVAPVFLSGTYIVVDELAQQKEPTRSGLRLILLRQVPHGLVRGLDEAGRAIPLMLVALCSAAASLAIHLSVWFVAGGAWANPWGSLGGFSLVTVSLAFGLGFALSLLLAASLIYALPLVLLREEGLGAAVVLSFRASLHHAPALAVPLLIALGPLLLRAIARAYSPSAAHVVGVLAGGVALPLVTASLYCSYRSLFPAPPTPR